MVREIYYNKDGVSLEELDSIIDNDWRMENDDDGGTLSSVSRIVQNIAISADTTITSSSLEEEDDGNPTFDVGGEDNSGGRSDRVDSPSSPNNNEERGDNDETTNTSSNEVVIGAHGLPRLRKRREIMIDNNRTALPHIEPPFYYEEEMSGLDNLNDMIKKTNIRRHFHDLLLQRPYIGDDGELAPELLSLWNRNTRMTLSGGQYLPFRMRRERGGQHQVQGEESDDTGPNFEVGGGADEEDRDQDDSLDGGELSSELSSQSSTSSSSSSSSSSSLDTDDLLAAAGMAPSPNNVNPTYEDDEALNIKVGREVVERDDGTITVPIESLSGTDIFGRRGHLTHINAKPINEVIQDTLPQSLDPEIPININNYTKARHVDWLLRVIERPISLSITREEDDDNDIEADGKNVGRRVMIYWDVDDDERSRGRVYAKLPNDYYMIDKHNQGVNMKRVHISDIEFVEPVDNNDNPNDPDPTQLQNHEDWKNRGRNYDDDRFDPSHNADFSGCRVLKQPIGDFNIADILRNQTGAGGNAAAQLYTNLVLNNVNEPRPGYVAFPSKTFEVYGHLYTIGRRNHSDLPIGSARGHCASKYCPAHFEYDNTPGQRSFYLYQSNHSKDCQLKRFLEMPQFSYAQKRVVVRERVRQWEQIYSLKVRVLCLYVVLLRTQH